MLCPPYQRMRSPQICTDNARSRMAESVRWLRAAMRPIRGARQRSAVSTGRNGARLARALRDLAARAAPQKNTHPRAQSGRVGGHKSFKSTRQRRFSI